jgi:hypothetical protein
MRKTERNPFFDDIFFFLEKRSFWPPRHPLPAEKNMTDELLPLTEVARVTHRFFSYAFEGIICE